MSGSPLRRHLFQYCKGYTSCSIHSATTDKWYLLQMIGGWVRKPGLAHVRNPPKSQLFSCGSLCSLLRSVCFAMDFFIAFVHSLGLYWMNIGKGGELAPYEQGYCVSSYHPGELSSTCHHDLSWRQQGGRAFSVVASHLCDTPR